MNDLHSFIPKTTPHATRAGSGNEHGVVINKEGKLYTFGYGMLGQLGLEADEILEEDGLYVITLPTHVPLPSLSHAEITIPSFSLRRETSTPLVAVEMESWELVRMRTSNCLSW